MGALRSVGSVIAAAFTYVGKAISRVALGGAKCVGGMVRGMRRVSIGIAYMVGRAVVVTTKSSYRAACVGIGILASVANNVIGFFARGSTELPEPGNQKIFEPDADWLEAMEEAYLAHEFDEVEGAFADEPNAEAYIYAVSNDQVRRNMDMSRMSPEVRGWCHSLCETERQLVKRAGCEKMLKHLEGKKLIQGVRKVKTREAILDFTQRNDSSYEMNQDTDLEPDMSMRLAT